MVKPSLALIVLFGIALAGCTSPGTAGQGEAAGGQDVTLRKDIPSAPITNTDACAMRLHDLSGGLLFFQLVNGRLPDSLDELAQFDQGPPLPETICPVSKRPYIYNPQGIYLQDRGESIVLYDPAPSHSNMRWAVTYKPATPTTVAVTKVIALPESFFLLHPPN